MVDALMVGGFFGWLAWKVGLVGTAVLLWVLAWFALLLVVLHVTAGLEPVPELAPAVIAGVWLAGHALFRARRGYWRSPMLRGVAQFFQARQADTEMPLPPQLGTPQARPWRFFPPGD